jgi:hypothetical protein
VPKRELHQLDLGENQNLKLARNCFHGKELSGPEVTGPSVVDQHIEVTGFGERGVECRFDGKPIGQIEMDPMQSRHFWDAFQIARCAPNLMTLRNQ